MQEPKYYQHIVDLPLRNFIDASVNDNLSALIITGFPNPEQLQTAWAQITSEYADQIGDSESKMYWQLFKEVYVLSLNIELVEVCVNLLRAVYVESFARELEELSQADFKLDPSDPEKYQADIQRCVNRSKRLIILHDTKKARLDAMEKQNTEQVKPTHEYYSSILITLSDHAKYEINDSITVFAFCERLNRFKKYSEQLAAQYAKQRDNR
jgi:hypothetical protein